MNLKTTALFVITFFLLRSAPQAQKNSKNFVNDLPAKIVQLENGKEIKQALPFSNIEIEDARQNHSSVGFINIIPGNIRKIVLKDELNTSLKTYIKSAYSLNNENDVNLFIVIKKLWLSEFIGAADNLNPTQTQWNPGIVFEVEFFSEKDGSYHALYKTDSIIATDASLSGNEAFYLQKAIGVALEKIANKNFTDIKSGKKSFTKTNMQNYISALYSYPIIKDSIRKKGVYKTLDEFKNNSPSIADFEIRKDAKADILYAKENNQSSLLRDFWGYCDGTNIYINSAGNFFKLFKCENTFNVKGFKYLKKHKQVRVENILMFGLAGGVIGRGNKRIIYKGDIAALQLDMDTGELF